MYLGRGTMTMKHFWDDFRVKRKRQIMWKGKNKPLALFLKTIFLKLFACEVFKDNRDNRDNFLCYWTLAFMIWNLKQASSKRANIHNRWWRERSERNLRIFTESRQDVLEEGEQKQAVNIPHMFALFLLWQATKWSARAIARCASKEKNCPYCLYCL